ncbi:MAG TPA: response regulator [Candidatus Saccharimonadales bacterium]|nr:response regulator [Candidatus Saccharimonadales bacterium]
MSKVLIVDDDASMQSLYQRIFQLEGFTVDVAKSGTEGLEKAAATPQPDIILLDMMMPVVNGIEVLEKIKADSATSKIPVIVMSNYSELNITARATQLGASYYLIKSNTEPASVMEMVRGVLAKTSAQ